MIRSLIVAATVLGLAGPTAFADTRDVYTVRDIDVEEAAPTVIEAQRNAFASARAKAAQTLIERLTLPEDRAAAGLSTVEPASGQRLAAAVDVQEEVRGGGRYIGVLSVVLNPRLVRPYLQQRGVAFVDSQAPLALVAPIGPDNWALAWGEGGRYTLAPYVTAVEAYPDDVFWVDLETEALRVGAQRGVRAELFGSPGAWRTRLTVLTAAGAEELGVTTPARTLEEAAAAAREGLEIAWKRQAVVRSGERTPVEANVFYTSIAEWNGLRRALTQSPRVSDFSVRGIARDGAVVRFSYAGAVDQLTSDLRQRGVALDVDDTGWIVTSAVFGAP